MPATVINGISSLFSYISNLLTWWIVLAPWEQAVRVRLGKHITVISAGIHAYVRAYRLIMDSRGVYFGAGPDTSTPQA